MKPRELPFEKLRKRPDTGGVSKLTLDRHLAGESLSDEERAAVERALLNDIVTQDHAHAARTDLVDLHELARLQSDLRQTRPGLRAARALRRWWAPLGALAAAALAFFVLRSPTTQPSEPGPDVRAKGGHGFDVLVRSADSGRVSRLLPSDTLHPADAVRFRVRAGEDAFVAIVGLDARGVGAVYEPAADPPIRVAKGVEHVFEGSIVLDASLGRERFTALFCRDPVGRATLVDRIAAIGQAIEDPLALPGCEERTFIVAKTP